MKIVIVGGGFGGVKAALELGQHADFSITLISDEDYFLHHATLYATATGRSRDESVVPLRDIFAGYKNVTVVKDRITSLDLERKLVIGKKNYPFEKAIFAMGVVTTYFGIKGLAEHSYGIKTLNEVTRFKQHLHKELTEDKHMDKNYVVVGAGPTGVELVAALKTYLTQIAAAHAIKKATINLTLVEAAPRVLPRMSEAASAAVTKRLQELGVSVLVNKKVESMDDDSVMIDGQDIPSQTVVWTSGVANHPFFAAHAHIFKLAKNGRVEVDRHLEAAPNVFVIGDNAATPYTGVATTALYDASFVARHLNRLANGLPAYAYVPKAHPVTVPVGDDWAIYESSGMRVTGKIAAALRRFHEFQNYKNLLSFSKAFRAWRARYHRDEDCPVCKKSKA
ncbi:MAG TPA: FAD-dependent oxidoreductase [Verrucomicrobiae bacterium]|nr:FAD-dependent oxidoreductase [Verrucomicrobiae bacterium]